MLTTRIYLAAMSRADLPPEKMREMPNFYFFVDEFQSFANATFANILSEARKYHLNLTIAHQYITQMEEEVRDAVFGNVGTIISFRVGPLDAEFLETIFTPQFLATDIVNLAFAQIYLTLMIDGIGSPPFSAKTIDRIPAPPTSCKDMVIAESRKQFTVKRALVEELILKFHEPVPKAPKIPAAIRPESSSNGNGTHGGGNGNGQSNGGERTMRMAQSDQKSRERRDQASKSPERSPSNNSSTNHVLPKPTEVTKAPRAEDLRAVLKRIAQKAQDDDSEEKSESKERTSASDLQQTLRALMPKVVDVQEEKEEAVHTEEGQQHTDTREPAEDAVTESAVIQNVDAPPVQSQRMQSEVQHTLHAKESRVTPKELERMMRVTTNDKPPV
jgi:hypothetical protein